MTIFKAIILDMDGTLVNTEKLWKKAEKAMLSKYGCTYDTTIHAQFLGMAVHEFIPAVHEAYDLLHIPADELDAELESSVMVLLEQETQPTSGAEALIQYIVEHEIPVAIASNSSHKMIWATLANQRWLDVIPQRFSSDDVPNAKPAPDLYLHVVEQLGFLPENCLAIEDSLTGIRSATSAGMTCYALPDAELADIEAYHRITPHVFASLVDVLKLIKSSH